MSTSPSHEPVLFEESISALQIQRGGRYIDCTINGGGHAAAILEESAPGGQLLGIDADPEAIKVVREKLKSYGKDVILVNQNFRVSAVGMWDLQTGQEMFTLDVQPDGIAFFPDGRSVALTFPTRGIETYDSLTGDRLSSLGLDFNAAAYSRDGDRLAISAYDDQARTSAVRMLDPAGGDETWSD